MRVLAPMLTRGVVVFAVLVGGVETAHALKPATHAQITRDSCRAAGLPKPFCERAAMEDYNTDSNEWDDLSAHAQIDATDTACAAADKAGARMYQLGTQLAGALEEVRATRSQEAATKVGRAFGRALHTIQDNCAHHGMPNPQHAWFSLIDFCTGTSLSPDLQDDAIACARAETEVLVGHVADAVRASGVASVLAASSCPEDRVSDGHANGRTECDHTFLPGPHDACTFLGEAAGWDGIDRQWHSGVVEPALRNAFARGLTGQAADGSVCAGDEATLINPISNPIVDVHGGAPSCGKAHLLCFGGADLDDNPFAGDVEHDAGGCQTGRGHVGLVTAFAVMLIRRRRRSV